MSVSASYAAVARGEKSFVPPVKSMSKTEQAAAEPLAATIDTRELDAKRREIKHLKAENSRLNALVAQLTAAKTEAPAVPAREPTAPSMETLLKDLQPLAADLNTLLEAINTLRDASQTKYENCLKLSKEALRESLSGPEGFVAKYNALAASYEKLAPKVLDKKTKLEETIRDATRSAIPSEHIATFSSHNQIPVALINEKAIQYQDCLARCKDALESLKANFSKTERRFSNAATHINGIEKHLQGAWVFTPMLVSWPLTPKKAEAPVATAQPVKTVTLSEETLDGVDMV